MTDTCDSCNSLPAPVVKKGGEAPGMQTSAGLMDDIHREDYEETDARRRHDRYNYSIQIRNLPETWAKSDRTTHSNLHAMLQGHTTVTLRKAYTSERCTNTPGHNERRFCYAFIDVDDQEQGDLFIRQIRQVQIDDIYLQARWSSKAIPRTPNHTHRVRNAVTGHVQEWHPRRGLTGSSLQGHDLQPEQVGPSQTAVSITYTPRQHEDCAEQQAQDGITTQSQAGSHVGGPAQGPYQDQQPQDQAANSHAGQGSREALEPMDRPAPDQVVAQQDQIAPRQGQVRDWNENDTFQAILQDGDRVPLTTYHQEESTWLGTRQVRQPQPGTMWDYHITPTRRAWLATPGQTTAGQAQDWLYQARRGSWIGAQYLVDDPSRIHMQNATRERHAAFLSVTARQQLTCLSPPVWVWTDGTQLAGLWCLLMTTYHTNASLDLPMCTIVETGLVPMSVVHKVSDY